MRGSCVLHAQFSLQSVNFSLRYAMGIMVGVFWCAFWLFSTGKYVVLIFAEFRSTCVHARPLNYLYALVLH